MLLDFSTGRFDGAPPQTRRTVGELGSIFADSRGVDPDTLVYETFGSAPEVEGPPSLLYATTVIQPGDVNGEFFMTRGHFHTNPERGEFMTTLQGEGALLLMDRERNTWTVPMSAGSVHHIDGRYAHRVANTGDVPLVFLVVWMSDCGHDYEAIRQHGFGKRLRREPA